MSNVMQILKPKQLNYNIRYSMKFLSRFIIFYGMAATLEYILDDSIKSYQAGFQHNSMFIKFWQARELFTMPFTFFYPSMKWIFPCLYNGWGLYLSKAIMQADQAPEVKSCSHRPRAHFTIIFINVHHVIQIRLKFHCDSVHGYDIASAQLLWFV